jgi:hypothetical protein
MLKQISLAAALAATVITGSAAVAYAEGDAGIHDAARQFNTSAGMERGYDRHAYAAAPMTGSYAYGYARGPVRIQSSKG